MTSMTARHSLRESLRDPDGMKWAVAWASVILLCSGGASRSAPAGWTAVAPMASARAAHAVVVADGAVYVLAGTGADGRPVLEVERFDGRNWAHETTLPGHGLNAPAAAVLGPRIYLIGGFDTTTNVPVAQVLVYDTATHRWSEAAPLPRPRGGHAVAVLEGRIHVIGGGNSESTIPDHSVYDPATDQWSSLAPLPRSMGSPAAVVHEGSLYSIGGRSGLEDFGDVWRYDSTADRWVAGPAIAARGTHGAISACGSIYVFGGESQPQRRVLADVLRLDRASNSWVALAPLPTPRNFARTVLFQDGILVVGGSLEPGSSHSSTGSRTVERFDPGCRP
jgi:N-acetylneuraminic acid mutarotase